jgi:hypothetical protein
MEQNRYKDYDLVLFVDESYETIIERLIARNNLTLREAEHRLSYFPNTTPYSVENLFQSGLIQNYRLVSAESSN